MHAIADGTLVGTWPCPVTAERVARLNGARAASAPLPPAATARRIEPRTSSLSGSSLSDHGLDTTMDCDRSTYVR